ncbi:MULTISPECIES: hypothetical protein [Comamonas]|jgi:hypothetical protein|uniref:hypothetical protein n=1 Tax=Comamonas TaxID=283 RepID=UPI000FD6A153|nr:MULTISPECIES: hypothetical protein [Comamonas]MBD9531029.1 hypothetical protein [Comamonas sp. CMM01]MDH1293078.1 hypothetical protein [Comamonas terrigena]
MNVKDLRDWLQLLFVVLGGFVALAAYLQNLRQRRVENALKFIGLFRDGLREKDLEHWQDLFIRSSESAGAKPGTFATEDGKYASVGEYFSEESGDGHAISRIRCAKHLCVFQEVR